MHQLFHDERAHVERHARAEPAEHRGDAAHAAEAQRLVHGRQPDKGGQRHGPHRADGRQRQQPAARDARDAARHNGHHHLQPHEVEPGLRKVNVGARVGRVVHWLRRPHVGAVPLPWPHPVAVPRPAAQRDSDGRSGTQQHVPYTRYGNRPFLRPPPASVCVKGPCQSVGFLNLQCPTHALQFRWLPRLSPPLRVPTLRLGHKAYAAWLLAR